MNLEYLKHNEKFISLEIQELENEIALLQQNMITKKILLRIDKYRKQILIYSHQLEQTKKQINGKLNTLEKINQQFIHW